MPRRIEKRIVALEQQSNDRLEARYDSWLLAVGHSYDFPPPEAYKAWVKGLDAFSQAESRIFWERLLDSMEQDAQEDAEKRVWVKELRREILGTTEK